MQVPSRGSSHTVKRMLKELSCREQNKAGMLDCPHCIEKIAGGNEKWAEFRVQKRSPQTDWLQNKKLNCIQTAKQAITDGLKFSHLGSPHWYFPEDELSMQHRQPHLLVSVWTWLPLRWEKPFLTCFCWRKRKWALNQSFYYLHSVVSTTLMLVWLGKYRSFLRWWMKLPPEEMLWLALSMQLDWIKTHSFFSSLSPSAPFPVVLDVPPLINILA